jgi:two-component system, OmpR family, heavy metal sensor histidine kinase CusS
LRLYSEPLRHGLWLVDGQAGAEQRIGEQDGVPLGGFEQDTLASGAKPSRIERLGLAILKAIMDLHAGEVTASSSATGTIRVELRLHH